MLDGYQKTRNFSVSHSALVSGEIVRGGGYMITTTLLKDMMMADTTTRNQPLLTHTDPTLL